MDVNIDRLVLAIYLLMQDDEKNRPPELKALLDHELLDELDDDAKLEVIEDAEARGYLRVRKQLGKDRPGVPQLFRGIKGVDLKLRGGRTLQISP